MDTQNSFLANESLTLDQLKSYTLTLGGELNKIVGAYGDDGIDSGTPDPVYFDNPVYTNGDNRGFLMTTIITDVQSDGFFRQRLDETEEGDPAATVTVSVGRAMAKVSLASDLTPFSNIPANGDPAQPYGTLEVEAYKIINNPDEMNVAIDVTSGIVMTPYFANTTVNTANYFVSNNTSQESENYYIPVSNSSAKTFAYCIENANNIPKYGNATIALIKGYFTPLSNSNSEYKNAMILDPTKNFSSATLGEKEDFYRIWIPAYEYNGQALGGAYEDEYFVEDPRPYLDDYLQTYKNLSAAEISEITAAGGLQVSDYPEGLCYYYLPLENATADSPYTVVRNSYYKIDIESVAGAGYPEDPNTPGEPDGPDKPGPEVPIEAQTNIKASIKVEKWDEVKQTGKL